MAISEITRGSQVSQSMELANTGWIFSSAVIFGHINLYVESQSSSFLVPIILHNNFKQVLN